MKFALVRNLTGLSALIAVNLLVACATKSGDPARPNLGVPARSGQGGFSETSGSTGLGLDGTSTSGGGTGANNKVFESYIVDLNQLAAYRDVVAPLLRNIRSAEKASYENFAKVKTWYIAPVELEKITKDLLGVSFFKSDTQQIARQTSKEIWIDKKIFDDRMSVQDQGELIIHEIVMTMYLLKFMSMTEVCRASAVVTGGEGDQDCVTNSANIDKAMPPEAIRPLNDVDNANIRFITGWLLQNAVRPVGEKDFIRQLASHGFDKRIFNPAQYDGNADLPPLKLPLVEVVRAIKGAVVSGNMPQTCAGLTSGQHAPCRIDVSERSMKSGNQVVQGFDLNVTVGNAAPISIFAYPGADAEMPASRDSDGGLVYSFLAVDWVTPIRIGDRRHVAIILFRQTGVPGTSLTVQSVIIKPTIITSIDKKRVPICLSTEPRVTTLVDDTLIAARTTPIDVVTQTYATATPLSACSPENVVE